MVGYRQAADSVQWSLAEGSGLLFPSVLEGGEMGELSLTPAQITTSLQTRLRTARVEDNRYTIRSFRVGGAASHSMDGAGARRHVRMAASTAASGAKRSRDTAFIDADVLPLSEKFASSYMQRSHGTIEAGPTRGQGRTWVY